MYAEGSSADGALGALPDDPIDRRALGESYAARITPLWQVEHRIAFRRGSAGIEKAFDAMSKDWLDEAERFLTKALASPKDKMRRRATHDLAVCHELRGDLEAALEMAEKAQRLGCKPASGYAETLRSRIRQRERLYRDLPADRKLHLRAELRR